uniref:Trimeric autotransporter adhesin YadA-like head domain-containing protein n=1 Tax=viral metagenome TaxID=1070528 RepID=A0A6C0BCR9_9ZZZZ
MGSNAGSISQSNSAVAIGLNAGNNNQGGNGVAIGRNAGKINQGTMGIAIGNGAGYENQGNLGIAIGKDAQTPNEYSIYIGQNMAGQPMQGYPVSGSSIVLNATGVTLHPSPDGLFVKPIRYSEQIDFSHKQLFYNQVTGEIIACPLNSG